MSVFTYRARDMNGLLIMGQMEASGLNAAQVFLAEQGLIPIKVMEGAARLTQNLSLNIFNKVKQEEIMLFTRQFHTLFKAGMDMETLLTTLAKQTGNKYFADTITRIKNDVAAGSSLSRAFAQHPKVFNELYVNMVATGEEAGILESVLAQLSSVIEKELRLKSSVKSGMLYPKIVVFVLVMATIVIMTFVMPKFEGFYGHYGADLPTPTKILMAVSHAIRNYYYIIGGVALAFWFAFKKWQATSKGKLLFDIFQWKLPVVGMLGKKVANARYANILSSLYKAGLPITRGLEITAKIIGHEDFKRDLLLMKADVEKGKSMAEAMRDKKYFSPLMIESTAIGEKSGALDEMYESIGGHYDEEVQHTLKNLTTLIEPILLFLIFGMVTVFMLAVFLPMWNISKVVM